jgi:hypothetical protein
MASLRFFVLLLMVLDSLFSGQAALSPTLVGAWPGYRRGPAYAVSIRDNYAFVAAQGAGLIVLEVSDSANPQRAAGLTTGSSALDVDFISEQVLLLVGDGSLEVIDVSNPRAPVLAKSLSISGTAFDVSVSGGHAFLAKGESGLEVFDLTVPNRPEPIARYQDPGDFVGVLATNNLAYLADFDGTLEIVGSPDSHWTVRRMVWRWLVNICLSPPKAVVCMLLM